MKKVFLFSSLCAAMLLTGCKSEEPVSNSGTEVSDGTPRYLSVNIVSNTGNGTRAEDDNKYENGLDSENKVTKVRFYFFDADGNAVNVTHHNVDHNWYDWTESSNEDYGSGVVDPNVERILNATIVISTKEGDALPSQMVAVVNPREALGDDNYDLDEKSLNSIRLIKADYATYANGGTIGSGEEATTLEGNYFPMYNSIYMSDGKEIIKATKIATSDYKKNADDAIKHPVEIYVERNVAKVRTSLALNDLMTVNEKGFIQLRSYDKETKQAGDFIKFPIYDADGNTTGQQEVYLDLKGWNVTSDMNKATLSKRIDIDWTDTSLGFKWNNPTFFRSYWALPTDGATCRYGNYNAAKSKPYYNLNKDEGFTYCNENVVNALSVSSSNYEQKQNTKVILAGTLCDEKGNALTICEYYGIKFVDDKKQTALKNSVLNYLTDNGYGTVYYKRYRNESGQQVIEKISADDITFEYVKGETADDSYYVHPILKVALQDDKYEWFTSDNAADGTAVGYAEIDNRLKGSQHAKIWNSGMTYYFADIKHFGNKIGVVRNHVYNMNINTIYGLGTPVWDPDRRIIPETTTDEDTYIGARINILSWRIVNNNVNLEW